MNFPTMILASSQGSFDHGNLIPLSQPLLSQHKQTYKIFIPPFLLIAEAKTHTIQDTSVWNTLGQ